MYIGRLDMRFQSRQADCESLQRAEVLCFVPCDENVVWEWRQLLIVSRHHDHR